MQAKYYRLSDIKAENVNKLLTIEYINKNEVRRRGRRVAGAGSCL